MNRNSTRIELARRQREAHLSALVGQTSARTYDGPQLDASSLRLRVRELVDAGMHEAEIAARTGLDASSVRRAIAERIQAAPPALDITND